MIKSPGFMYIARWLSDLDWRFLFLIIPPLSLLVFLSLSSSSYSPMSSPFSTLAPLSFFFNRTLTSTGAANLSDVVPTSAPLDSVNWTEEAVKGVEKKKETGGDGGGDGVLAVRESRMAVCLVGGARRFELTGPSIVENILRVYPNSDLFLHTPLDNNAFKLSLLKAAPRLASVRIFQPEPVPETESQLRVLTAANSPNGIQGLLQYFSLVEGCLTMIREYQNQHSFTYDWIVRTRVDGYWNAPLGPENFIPGVYLVPPGSSYGGLNDRLGIGDLNTTTVALSRLSLIPKLDSVGFRQLNSETAFKAQLTAQHIPFVYKRLPFCVVSDRKYGFPPTQFGVPVAALSSPGPLSGAKCRPCKPVCEGDCVANVMNGLYKWWSWTDWENGTLKLCDAHGDWEKGWERTFDGVAGKKLASARKKVWRMKLKQCVDDFKEMKRRAFKWDTPPLEEICKLGGLAEG